MGYKSTTTFRIFNDGYDSLSLRCKIPNNIDGLPIKFEWVEGRRLGVTQKKIRINVSFQWDRPLSFTKKLVFIAKEGMEFPIMISGTTDNSIFTV